MGPSDASRKDGDVDSPVPSNPFAALHTGSSGSGLDLDTALGLVQHRQVRPRDRKGSNKGPVVVVRHPHGGAAKGRCRTCGKFLEHPNHDGYNMVDTQLYPIYGQ